MVFVIFLRLFYDSFLYPSSLQYHGLWTMGGSQNSLTLNKLRGFDFQKISLDSYRPMLLTLCSSKYRDFTIFNKSLQNLTIGDLVPIGKCHKKGLNINLVNHKFLKVVHPWKSNLKGHCIKVRDSICVWVQKENMFYIFWICLARYKYPSPNVPFSPDFPK